MNTVQLELVESYRLNTILNGNHVKHTRYSSETSRMEEEDWTVCEEIGKGSFGTVHKQCEERTGRLRAVKSVDLSRLPAPHYSTRESHIMAILAEHPSLFVQFFGWFEDTNLLYLTMEYIPQGDLGKHLVKPLPEETVRDIAKQLLEGLKVMHEAGMAHRDLKPANIFVDRLSPIRVKLGDFGISKQVQVGSDTNFHTQVFTELYAAPEALGFDYENESSFYTNAVDIWSLGCVLYELLVGEKLFSSTREIQRYYHKRATLPVEKLKTLTSPVTNSGILFFQATMSIVPDERPSAVKAAGYSWLVYNFSDGSYEGEAGIDTIDNTLTRRFTGLSSQTSPNWKLSHEIAGGRFGTIYLEKVSLSDSRPVRRSELWAVKRVLKKSPNLPAAAIRRLVEEMDGFRELSQHEWFVRLIRSCEDDRYIYIAMEYIPIGNMTGTFINGYRWNESDAKIAAQQLLQGLAAMHREGIIHGDLKPENIFLVLSRSNQRLLGVKISNFGVSKRITGNEFLPAVTRTLHYMAPEINNGAPGALGNRSKVDIWSLGCILYQMLVGEVPFKTREQLRVYCEHAEPPPVGITKIGLSATCIEYMKDILQPQPRNRSSAETCLKLPWITTRVPGSKITISTVLYHKLLKLKHRAEDVETFPGQGIFLDNEGF